MNFLFRRWFFPFVPQLFTLCTFGLLIAGGLAANTDDMAFAKVLRNTNIANLIVWSYWWPLIILSAIILGRVWCMVCPMELLTTLASRIGLKRNPPAFLRSGWVITCFFVLILFVGIHTLAIHRIPYRMAIYMMMLIVVAVVTGLLFSRNTFCAYVCPVGHLLGLYARLAPFGWSVKDRNVCGQCKDKSCISKETAYKFQGRSCGVGLYPAKLDDNTQCLLCGQCLKACNHNNPGLSERPNPGWFPRRLFKEILELKPFTIAQAVFCLVVSGFVIYEIFTEWSTTKEWLLWIPTKLNQALALNSIWTQGMIKSITLFVILPLILWLLPFGLFRMTGGQLSMKDYLLKFGIAFIPIMAAAHAIKSLLKMTSRIPYWEYTFNDIIGAETAQGLIDKSIVLSPLPVWREPVITILSLLLMTVGIVLSIWIVRKLSDHTIIKKDGRCMLFYLIPLIYGGAFLTMLIAWRLF